MMLTMMVTTALLNYQKQVYLPHIKRDDAHMYEGACMKAQHKTIPDGTGAGRGCIMTKNIEKGRFVLDKQETCDT